MNREEIEKDAMQRYLLPKFCFEAIITLKVSTLPHVRATHYLDDNLRTRTIEYFIEDGCVADLSVLSETP